MVHPCIGPGTRWLCCRFKAPLLGALSSFVMKAVPVSSFLISKPSGVGFLKAAPQSVRSRVSGSAPPRQPNGQGWLDLTFPSNGL